MADEAHVINVRVRLVRFRQQHRLVPELKPVHARLALGDGEKRFAVHALGADDEHNVLAPLHRADIERGVDTEPFQKQRIGLGIQIVAPFQRDVLGGDDRIFPPLKPAVVKAGVHGVAPFQQCGMALLQGFQILLECSHNFDGVCLPQKGLMQAAIHRDDLAGSFRQALRDQQEIRFCLIRRCDG